MTHSAADRRARQQERRDRRAAVTDPDVVLAAGAALLGMRARTTHDLRARLVAMGYQLDLVEETIQRLETLGYLDDAGFARAWVAGRDRGRPRGAAALRRELTGKGIDRDLVDATLHERNQQAASPDQADSSDGPDLAPGPDAPPGTADLAAAIRLLERRRTALAREPDVRRRRQRAYALLARNGFDPGICMEATRASLASPDEDEPGEV